MFCVIGTIHCPVCSFFGTGYSTNHEQHACWEIMALVVLAVLFLEVQELLLVVVLLLLLLLLLVLALLVQAVQHCPLLVLVLVLVPLLLVVEVEEVPLVVEAVLLLLLLVTEAPSQQVGNANLPVAVTVEL